MKINDTGYLAPNQECATPSTQPPTTKSEGSIGVTLAIALPILAVFIIVNSACLIAVLLVCIYQTQKEKASHTKVNFTSKVYRIPLCTIDSFGENIACSALV